MTMTIGFRSSLMSKGLGANAENYIGDFLRDTLTPYVMLNGIKYPIPRYYKEKLKLNKLELQLKTREHYEKRQHQIETTLNNRGLTPFDIAALSVDACHNAKKIHSTMIKLYPKPKTEKNETVHNQQQDDVTTSFNWRDIY